MKARQKNLPILPIALIASILCTRAGVCQEPAPQKNAAKVGVDEKQGEVLSPDLTFFAEDGTRVRLGDLIDKPTILTLVYYECPSICGPLLNGVCSLIDEMDLAPGTDYQVISISFNEQENYLLAAKKKKNFHAALDKQIPASAWRFLAGDKDNVTAITNAAGFRYERIETEYGPEFNHPGTLIILSPGRMITGYVRGIEYVPADVKMALAEALQGKTRATRAPVGRGGLLSFCYTYDPKEQQRVLSITRVAGVGTLALAGVFILLVLLVRSKPPQVQSAPETAPQKD